MILNFNPEFFKIPSIVSMSSLGEPESIIVILKFILVLSFEAFFDTFYQ